VTPSLSYRLMILVFDIISLILMAFNKMTDPVYLLNTALV